jgi:hypothetical protein
VSLEQRVRTLEQWREAEERRAADRATWRLFYGVNALTAVVIAVVVYLVESYI